MDRRCSWRFRIIGEYHIGVTVREPPGNPLAVLWGLKFDFVKLMQCSYDAASGRDWQDVGDAMPVGYPNYDKDSAPRLEKPRLEVDETVTEVTLSMNNGALFFGFNGGTLQEAMRGFPPSARLHPYVGLYGAQDQASLVSRFL